MRLLHSRRHHTRHSIDCDLFLVHELFRLKKSLGNLAEALQVNLPYTFEHMRLSLPQLRLSECMFSSLIHDRLADISSPVCSVLSLLWSTEII